MLTVLILFILASLIGCGPRARFAPGGDGSQSSTQGPSTPETIPEESMETQPRTVATISPTQVMTATKSMSETPLLSPLGHVAAESIKLAKLDLAQRLGIEVDGITASAFIGQEFSADAFYCRTAKDRVAKDDAPAVISGFSILLSTSGRRYEYHASDQTVVFCRPLP